MIRAIIPRSLTLLLVVASCTRDRAVEVPPSPRRATPADEAPGYAPIAPAPAAGTQNQIAVGMGYACVRTTGDRLTCWGGNFPDRPTVVAGVEHVAGVVAGRATMCAWTTSGEVFCTWGGPLQHVEGLSDVVELATDPDGFVTCARRGSGHVACWSEARKPGPVHDVDQVTGALEVAVADATACIRDAEGVGCWDTSDGRPVVRRIAGAAGATRIAGGYSMFIAVRASRPPVGWDPRSDAPVAVPALPGDVVQIALGGGNACALGRAVQCWRLDDLASLHEIPNVDHAREIAAGDGLACAHVEHRVACWGAAGSLGDGTPSVTHTPVVVSNLDDATRLSIVFRTELRATRDRPRRVLGDPRARHQRPRAGRRHQRGPVRRARTGEGPSDLVRPLSASVVDMHEGQARDLRADLPARPR